MVNLGKVLLVGVIVTVGTLAIAGTNLAFAQQPCGAQAYAYIGCTPMGAAQMYGVAMVGAVVAFCVGVAVASGHLQH